MDAKDLRTEAALGERSSDGSNKYNMGTPLPCNVNKTYPEISSNPLAKVDTPTSRPCAVIGPDRILPPSTNTDAYLKKSHYEPWPLTESTFRHPPEYPHKTYQSPIRNISPRQTFQENMQRIMVAPTYNSMKMNEETNFALDRNATLGKNKLSGSADSKYCDVPYSINHLSDNQKNAEMCVSNVNNSRNCPPIWHPSGINIRPTRPYGAPDLYQFPDYASCAGPRTMAVTRPPLHRAVNEENSHLYTTEAFYHHGNVRFKPYPNVKERYQQARYEYVNNYPNPYHPPPPFPPHKYDLHKPVPSHPAYPQVPIKYLDNRMSDSVIDGYQRPNQQINYNAPYQNQMLHPTYGPVIPNPLHSKLYPYPPEKTVPANKPPFENNKVYLDYDNSRNKGFPENFYGNDISRSHMKSQVLIPNYPAMNMPPIPPHPYYRKESHSSKSFDYMPQYRNVDPNINANHLTRITPQFSPNGIAISPSDSNTSNDTAHTHSNSLEDCGYASQSSTASVRSIESGMHRIMPNDIHRRYSYGYPSMVRTSPFATKLQSNINHNVSLKDKKGIDVRQFLQMWNEGDDENAANKETLIDFNGDSNKSMNQFEGKTQEQLYVLGLVNVPSEELGKYEHIQKVSKLPDNIKGYNNIELLKHFEEAIESSNLNKTTTTRNFQSTRNPILAGVAIPARPISPLDVEAKISQSVIHKEVGCNFEIRPCSPEMLNVEVATPVQNMLEERIIEKVSNPYQSPVLNNIQESARNCNAPKQDNVIILNENVKIPSCKLINNQCSNSDVLNVIRPDYSLQDLESNSGVCLASLPRLDNDIELSFPEVNQQFINANKESVITSNDSQRKSDVNNSNSDKDDTTKPSSSKEAEKEFSKLSKYRKNKKSDLESKEMQSTTNSQILRTDSVIIKNPENVKYFEDIGENSSNTTNLEKQQDVLNLKPSVVLHTNTPDNSIQEPDNDNNMAIDFSVHKSNSIVDTERNILDIHENSYELPSCTDTMSLENKLLQSNEIALENCDLPKLSSDNIENDLSEKQHSSKSATHITEKISETNTNEDFTQDLNENNDEEIMVQKENLEPVLCIPLLSSPNEKDESNRIVENVKKESNIILDNINESDINVENINESKINVNETSTITKGLPSFNCEEDINQDFGNQDDVEKHKSITRNSNLSPIKLDANDIPTLENETNCKDDIILVPSESKDHMVSSHCAANEQIEDVQEMKNSSTNHITQSGNESPERTCDDNAFEFRNLTENISNKSTSGYESKSCNLKKELLSPWIQKLILQSVDIMPKTDTLIKGFNNIASKYQGCADIEYVASTSSNFVSEECNLNSTKFETESEKPINSLSDKKEPITERTQLNESPHIPIVTPENVCGEGGNENTNLSTEYNDPVQTPNILIDVSAEIIGENGSDEDENVALNCIKQSEPIQLTNIPSGTSNVSSDVCGVQCKKADEYFTEQSETVGSPVMLLENSSEDCVEDDKNIIDSSTKCEMINDVHKDQDNVDESKIVCFAELGESIKSPDILRNMSSGECSDECETKTSSTHTTNTNNSKKYHDEDLEDNKLNESESFTVQNKVLQIQNIENDLVGDIHQDLDKNKIEHFPDLTIPIQSPESNNETRISDVELNEIMSPPNIPIDDAKGSGSQNLQNSKIYNITPSKTEEELNDLLKTDEDKNKIEHFPDLTIPIQSPEPNNETRISDVELNEIMSPPNIPIDDAKGSGSQNLQNSKIDNITPSKTEEELNDLLKTDEKNTVEIQDIATLVITDSQGSLPKLENICLIQNSTDESKPVLQNPFENRRHTLKRSLSDSALDIINTDLPDEFDNGPSTWSKKRRKNNELLKYCGPHQVSEKFCDVQNNRRNSISSLYNEDNLSFCIVIDEDCLITQDNEEKICFAEVSDETFSEVQETHFREEEEEYFAATTEMLCPQADNCEISQPFVLDIADANTFEESWVDDIGCVETVVSDDVAEDVTISAPSSPQQDDVFDNDETIFNSSYGHTDKVKYIYGDKMCNDDAEFVETLYRTPQMNVNKTLTRRESRVSGDFEELDENDSPKCGFEPHNQHTIKNELKNTCTPTDHSCLENFVEESSVDGQLKPLEPCEDKTEIEKNSSDILKTQDCTVNSCESSIDNVFLYNQGNDSLTSETPSSPEVSSTTSEEKSSSILLKITNFEGMRTSSINESNVENSSSNCCKFTENINYTSYNNSSKPRQLITKGAQKYIPPLAEPLDNLKVKLPLPQQSLLKLKQLKIAKTLPKQSSSQKRDICKKPKPRFEDVLKSIDEIQFKMHKEKSKKPKKSVPKVVIKKNENGSHYASMHNKAYFNPDLTGRKWQPWVFIEKDSFIDKMAIKKKTKAIFNHRRNTYVLADKFRKYKSALSTKFIISQPKLDDSSVGHLKYTIKLKHTY